MAETVGQHSVAAFTSPVNGTSPIDANTVKGNDNTIRSAYVDHDADPGIHVQSSTLASRPVANSAGRKWMTQDSGVIRLFYDDGTSWYEVDYLRTTGGTISGNLSITGTLAVTGVATFTAQPILSSLTASRAVFTDGSKGLVSNAITGTGDVVMSASPTLTGTITAASATLSGTLGVSGLLTFASLKGTGATTVTNILDEDNMASDSATALATQQSIKAYVDAQVGASDALSEVLAIGNTTGANDIIVSAGQKIRTPAVAAQDGSSAITIANTTGALTLATALADSNLATISTAGKVSNSATTATSANTASAIVARDASGNFTAGTITAALTGNASTATTLQTARNINGVSFNGSADITVTAAAGTLTGTTLASNVTASSLTSVGTLANLTVTNPITGSVTGSSGSTTGNAATATALQTARNINGVSFNGTADITVTAAAGTLTGTTLASGVTASSLTSVGTLSSLTVSGDLTVDTSTLKVDSANNRVGVGTASPGAPLDSVSDSSAIGLKVRGRSSDNFGLIQFTANNGTTDYAYLGTPTANTLAFYTNGFTERMRLDASGNLAVDTNTLYVDAVNNRVGIGTASPLNQFSVASATGQTGLNAGTASSPNRGNLWYDTDGSGWKFQIGKWQSNAFTAQMTFQDDGKIGIGTASPGYPLDVVGAGRIRGDAYLGTHDGSNKYYFERFGAGLNAYLTSGSADNNASQGFILQGRNANGVEYNTVILEGTSGTGTSAALHLDASGNLGLGVTPSAWGSGWKALQIGSGGPSIWTDSGRAFYTSNVYFDGTNRRYVTSNPAVELAMDGGAMAFKIAASGTAGNAISFTQAMTLDASGNLGLGAGNIAGWDTYTSLELPSSGYVSSGVNWMEVMYNTYYASGAYRYKANGAASHYLQQNGAHSWHTASSGTAGNAITFTQAMTLNASGNLGIGTTSPQTKLHVAGEVSVWSSGTDAFRITSLAAGSGSKFLSTNSANTAYAPAIIEGSIIGLNISGSERARITAGGYFKASNNGTYVDSASSYHELRSTTNDSTIVRLRHAGTSGTQYGVQVETDNDQNNATNWFLYCAGGATERATIRSNGGLANYSANNVNLASDFRLKKDIAPLTSTWDKLKAIEVVNFRYKDCNEDDPALYGVIAQQVQPIVPELVVVTREAVEAKDAVLDEDGNEVEPAVEAKPEYYGIREQPMYWLAIKALQEAQARIESLEARLAALES